MERKYQRHHEIAEEFFQDMEDMPIQIDLQAKLDRLRRIRDLATEKALRRSAKLLQQTVDNEKDARLLGDTQAAAGLTPSTIFWSGQKVQDVRRSRRSFLLQLGDAASRRGQQRQNQNDVELFNLESWRLAQEDWDI